MVARSNHGGACCGARHLFGFGTPEDDRPDYINERLREIDNDRHVDVKLNLSQMRGHTNIVQRLADLGFVMDAHFKNGNHDSHVFSFSRCDNRLPMTEAEFRRLGIRWPGQVISAGLTGRLTRHDTVEPGAEGHGQHVEEGAQAPAPIPARIVISLYSNVYRRSGRSTVRYQTAAAAVEARRGRQATLDRLDVMSNGSMVWAGNVEE